MGGDYRNKYKGSGAKKDFKADPIKSYLTTRGVCISYAKDLVIAGRVKLDDLGHFADKLTLLNVGGLKVDDVVANEIMRVANRVRAKIAQLEKEKGTFEEFWKENPENEDDQLFGQDCPAGTKTPSDDETEFDVARERERYEQEQAEENARHPATKQDVVEQDEDGTFTCKRCGKNYKTSQGLHNHINKMHKDKEDDGNYGDHK